MSKRVIGVVVPGSQHVHVHETTYYLVECGNCGHQQHAYEAAKMPWCERCHRQMVLQQAENVENVIPIRRPRK